MEELYAVLEEYSKDIPFEELNNIAECFRLVQTLEDYVECSALLQKYQAPSSLFSDFFSDSLIDEALRGLSEPELREFESGAVRAEKLSLIHQKSNTLKDVLVHPFATQRLFTVTLNV